MKKTAALMAFVLLAQSVGAMRFGRGGGGFGGGGPSISFGIGINTRNVHMPYVPVLRGGSSPDDHTASPPRLERVERQAFQPVEVEEAPPRRPTAPARREISSPLLPDAIAGVRRMQATGTPWIRSGGERMLTAEDLTMRRFMPEYVVSDAPRLGGGLTAAERIERRGAESRLRRMGLDAEPAPLTAESLLVDRFLTPAPQPPLRETLLANRMAAERPGIAAAWIRPSFLTERPEPRASARSEVAERRTRAEPVERRERSETPRRRAAQTGSQGQGVDLSWLPRERAEDRRPSGAPLIGGVATIDASLLPLGAEFISDPRAIGATLLYDRVMTTTGQPAFEYISLPVEMFIARRADARWPQPVSPAESDAIARGVKEMSQAVGKYVTQENLVGAARATADFLIPGGLEHVEAYLRGEISGSEFLVREAWGVATDVAFIAIGGPVGKAIGKVGGKIVRKYIGNTLVATERAATVAAVRTAESAAARTAREYAVRAVREAPVMSAREIGWTGAARFWKTGVTPRGVAFEKHLERTLPVGTQKRHFLFKTFDFTKETERGIEAISAKTIDTTTEAATKQGSKQVLNTVNKYIREMVNFEKARYLDGTKRRLQNSEIWRKELQLGIPADTSPECMRQIKQAIENARQYKIDVVVTKIIDGA